MIKTPFETPPTEGEAVEVAPGVLWMRLPLPMALDHVNVFAFDDPDGWTIVDTGFASKRSRAIWDKLLAGPLGGKPVARLIVTHHHPDHIGLAGWFIGKGAELCMPRTGWLMARMLTFDEQPVPSPEAITFYTRAGMDPAILKTRKTERPFNFADCVAPLPQGYTRLAEGGTIAFGGRVWNIRMGNGHAPEHLTLWDQSGELVIGGDQLILSISPNLGVYPTEPEADPVQEWLESCEKFQGFATPDQLILPGHKLIYRGLPKRLEQLISNHNEALDRLLEFLNEPRAAGECFPPLFKRKIGAGEYGLALVEAVAHLNHLHQSGKVSRDLRADGAYVFKRLD